MTKRESIETALEHGDHRERDRDQSREISCHFSFSRLLFSCREELYSRGRRNFFLSALCSWSRRWLGGFFCTQRERERDQIERERSDREREIREREIR